MRQPVLLIPLLLLAFAVRPAGAQAVIKGHVRAVQTQSPLAMAEILIENLNIRAWTNDSGYFRIADIPIGSHALRIRRIGFEGAIATLRVESADSIILALDLQAWVPELETIFVKAPRRSRIVRDIEERKRTGFGRFLMPEDLREHEHLTLPDLLRRLGVEVLHSPQGNDYVAVGRSSGPAAAGRSMKCDLRILINGMPVHTNNLGMFPLSQLEAVEVYRSATEAPIQYVGTGASCGIILLWSRSG